MAEITKLDERQVKDKISKLQGYWQGTRNQKFKEWYDILLLVDKLKTTGMESYVSNEPATFYQMAHYLLTTGDISHFIPIQTDSAADLDIRARVHRGCQHMWDNIDRDRRAGGGYPFISEFAFYALVLGWYSVMFFFDNKTGLMKTQIWNPTDTYPSFSNGRLSACVHTYNLTIEEAMEKAEASQWKYKPRAKEGTVGLKNFFMSDGEQLYNMVLIDDKDVTGWQLRPEILLMVAPIAGYPDKGSIQGTGEDWKKLVGKGIFEINAGVSLSFNKWKSMVNQILRDTAQPITQEFSATPQATVEELRERGGFFHYAPNEQGLQRVSPAAIPLEVQGNLIDLGRERQKGSFTDAVYGMAEGQPGYALSLLASSSANQILYPYMQAKHFVLSEADRFWLKNLKTSKRTFEVKGKFIEKLKPTDIPEDVTVIVESEVSTPKDWLEKGTIGGLIREDVDKATLLGEIYKLPDPQGIMRRQKQDRVLDNPMTQQIELIAGFYAHADYLDSRGDGRQAAIFRTAASALESQLGAPAPGQGTAPEMGRINQQREAASPRRPRVTPEVSPPENKGFTPQQLRQSIGRGKVRAV